MYRPGTGYTALYTCFNSWLQSVPTRYRLHSLVHLPQRLVTECTDQYYTALYTCFNNWLQSVPTSTGYTALFTCWLQNVQTDYRLNSLVQLLQQLVTVYRPATQSYTVASTAGYSVPATQPCIVCQLVTECTDWLQATQSAPEQLASYYPATSPFAYFQPALRITSPRSSTS